MERSIRKFNPGVFQSDEEVTEQFVVRNHDFGVLLNVLRGNIASSSCQHVLIVAPRGRGKTMLLARVAAEIRTSSEFARHMLAVRFMEENQEIFNLADFWLETLFHLARECALYDRELAQELCRRHDDLSVRWREQMLEEHARAAVLNAAARLNRKLVLMVENFQALCKDVDQDFGWKLRETLQTEPHVTLLASATSRFMELDDVQQPFFELFRLIHLKPLTTNECRALWQVVSGDSVSQRQMRPLEILTGGSPRLLVIVAGFARHRSLRHLMEELVTLIDEHTEYFRGHLESLGKTERRVYIAVLDLWHRSTPGEIARRARMDIRVVSTMLGRLYDRGALVTEGHGRKRKYAAAEPLYCIYYKLRRNRGEAVIVENLIRFMSVFYGEAEMTEIIRTSIFEAFSPSMQEGFNRVVAALVHENNESIRSAVSDDDFSECFREKISEKFDQQAFESVVDIVDRFIATQDLGSYDAPKTLFSAWALSMKAEALVRLDKKELALSVYGEIVQHFGGSKVGHVQIVVAFALANKGCMQERLGDLDSAVLTYGQVIQRFGNSENPDIKEWVIKALNLKGVCLQKLGNLDLALATYTENEEQFIDAPNLRLKRDIATGLCVKGSIQKDLGDLASAVSIYEAVIRRFGDCEDMLTESCVVLALINKANILTEMGYAEEALYTCGEFESRLCTLDVQGKRDLMWKARLVWILTLLATQGIAAAVEKFRSLYDVFVSDNESMIHEILEIVVSMIVGGSSAHVLLDILSSDASKATVLTPLVVALRQHVNESVREPDEILQVAADIRERILERSQ